MPLNLKCTCGGLIAVTEEQIGKKALCPKCGKAFVVPERLRAKVTAQTVPVTPPPPSPEQSLKCPTCGTPVDPGSVLCLTCGYNFKTKGVLVGASGIGKADKKARSRRLNFGSLVETVKANLKTIAIVLLMVVIIGGAGLYLWNKMYRSGRRPPPPVAVQPPAPAAKGTQSAPAPTPTPTPSQTSSAPTPSPAPAKATSSLEKAPFAGFADPARECGRRLQGIHSAIFEYATAHGGAYPESLGALVPEYIKADAVASSCCPLYKETPADLDKCYVYVGSEVAALRRWHLVARDAEARHADGTVMGLFSDGLTRPLTDADVKGVTLARNGDAWLTPAETEFVLGIQAEVRLFNDRFDNAELVVDGASMGKTPYQKEGVYHVAAGKHKIAIAAKGQRTEELEMPMRSGMAYRFWAAQSRDLPIIYIRNYMWALTAQRQPNAQPPPGPTFTAVGPEVAVPAALPRAGPDGDYAVPRPASPQPVVTGPVMTLRGSNGEVVSGLAGKPVSVDAAQGAIHGTIQRAGIRYEGIDGGPIKVNAIQRIAQGKETAADGTVTSYLSSSLGTIVLRVEPSLYLAQFAELKAIDGKKPWLSNVSSDVEPDSEEGMRRRAAGQAGQPQAAKPLVVLPTSLDVAYPSLAAYCDIDALQPEVRAAGQSVMRDLRAFKNPKPWKAPVATPVQPAAPATRALPLPGTSPSGGGGPDPEEQQRMMMVSGPGGGRPTGGAAGFLGPGSFRSTGLPPGMEQEREDVMNPPSTQAVDRRMDVVAVMGFYMKAEDIPSLMSYFGTRTSPEEKGALAIALGRIGSPMAIADITGWSDWVGGPPRQAKSAEPDEPGAPRSASSAGAGTLQSVVALSLLDSPFGAAGAARAEWLGIKQGKEQSQEYVGRKALERILKTWRPEQMAIAMRAWPDMAIRWPELSLMLSLGASGGSSLSDLGVLAEGLRFDPGATVVLCRRQFETSQRIEAAWARVLCHVGDGETVQRLLAKAKSGQEADAYLAVVGLCETRDAALIAPLKPVVDVALKSGQPAQKVDVLLAWEQLHAATKTDMKDVIAVAKGQLDAESPIVKSAALAVLAREGGVDAVIPALKSNDKKVVVAALQALASLGDDKAAAAVAEAVKTDDAEVLPEAIKAVGALRVMAAQQRIASLMDKAQTDPKAEPLLIECIGALGNLGSTVPQRKGLFSRTLGKLGSAPASPAEARALTGQVSMFLIHASPKVRAKAASALGDLATPESAGGLGRALGDKDAGVRVAAVQALAKIRAPQAYQELANRAFPMQGPYTDVSWPALQALVKMNTPEAYEAMRLAVSMDQPRLWSVVSAAYTELPEAERSTCLAFLASFLKDTGSPVRYYAAQGMAELGLAQRARTAVIAPAVNRNGIMIPIARVIGEARNPDDADLLNQMYTAYEQQTAKAAAAPPPTPMPGMPGEEFRPQSVEPDPRPAIYKAMGKIGGKKAAGYLSSYALKTQDEQIIKEIVQALAMTNAPEAVGFLAQSFPRTRGAIRTEVMNALSEVGHASPEVASRPLMEATKDPDPGAAAAAADALDGALRGAVLRAPGAK
jgi:HEAT repeat protein